MKLGLQVEVSEKSRLLIAAEKDTIQHIIVKQSLLWFVAVFKCTITALFFNRIMLILMFRQKHFKNIMSEVYLY